MLHTQPSSEATAAGLEAPHQLNVSRSPLRLIASDACCRECRDGAGPSPSRCSIRRSSMPPSCKLGTLGLDEDGDRPEHVQAIAVRNSSLAVVAIK